jgi:hypothetical protein
MQNHKLQTATKNYYETINNRHAYFVKRYFVQEGLPGR